MAWLVGDGFDFYNTFANLSLNTQVWQTATQGIINAGGRFGIGRWCQLGNSSATLATMHTIQFANSNVIFVNANIISAQAHVNGGTAQCVGFSFRDTTGFIQCGVYLRNGGDFVVTSGAIGSAVLATSPVLAPTHNAWMHVQIKITIHNTAGSIELRHINAAGTTSPVWTATGLNTRNGTANFYANIIQPNSTTPLADGFDDFYVFNDQGAQPNTWQGDVFAVQQFPTTDVAVSWTRNSGVSNCLAVDDPVFDGDTTYVSTNVVNNVDTYSITPLFTVPASIISVSLKYITRMDDAGPHVVNASLTSGPTTVTLPDYPCTNAYNYQQALYTTDPNTGSLWAAQAVNDVLLSVKAVL